MDKNTFIIYQGSGGLVHMLGGLVYCCDYVSKNKNRRLIVDTINHEAFQNKVSKYFDLNIDYYEDYSVIPENITKFRNIPLSFLENNNAIFVKGKGHVIHYNNNYYNYNQNFNKYNPRERIMYYCGTGGNNRQLILKYITVNNITMDKIKNYINSQTNIKNYIGVHFRNTDLKNDINNYIKQLQQYKNKTIYLATDDYKALDLFKQYLPDTEFITFTKPYEGPCENIHFGNPDKDEIIMNVLIDMYILYHSDVFIMSPLSLVSKLVKYMRDNNKSIFL